MHPRELLESLGASPQKKFSQNFLTSPHWADKLTDALIADNPSGVFFEIGPGLGALTARLLAKTDRPVVLFEIDRKFAEYARKTFPQATVVEGDFLEASLDTYSEKLSVLSNMPYHLSSPVLFRLLEIKPRLQRLVLTFQKEFARRIYAKPDTDDYSSLSVAMQAHFTIQSLGVVPPKAFYPPPAVDSEAVVLTPNNRPYEGLTFFHDLVRTAFSQRRKTLGNVLKNFRPTPTLESAFSACGLDLKARAETLSVDDYLRLAAKLSQT